MTDIVFDPKAFVSALTTHPGVYRMFNASNEVLYVGKAKNLKNRVGSYFRSSGLSAKTQALVQKITSIEVTVTNSETEALLLEQNFIKELKPPYNILLRDDKSYPYIFISIGEDYPRVSFHRGAKKKKGRYFGPYPSAGAVRESLNLLQKVFLVRPCEDSFFKNRSRPCLQYQIKRCSAPCVDHISPPDYQNDLAQAIMFLEGKSSALVKELGEKMEKASELLEFEQAAHFRDQIAHLQRVQEQQYVTNEAGDVDVIAAATASGGTCVQVLFIRGGRVLGNKTFYPKEFLAESASEVLAAFLPQFYMGNLHGRTIPAEVLVSSKLEDNAVIEQALSEYAEKKIKIVDQARGHRARWIKLAVTNADQALSAFLSNRQNILSRFESLQDALKLDTMPQRIECFDISHSSGEATVASCVVFDTNGPLKSDYRRFNIEGITGGDDYAAMAQALERRYTRIKKGEGKVPDLLLIDGGKGQITQAKTVFEELQLEGVMMLGVAKGTARKPGLESLIKEDFSEINVKHDSPALLLIQQIRDEAHRFAITGHRGRRAKARNESSLESIPGVGPKRRKELLKFFGGGQEVKKASAEELAKAPGISRKLGEEIYNYLHSH